MAWTDEQIYAINARNSNLLVSAAAGSGKTAVLVERIIRRVMDENNPIDIDSILVVTFTKAAAGEMKSRIMNAFSEEVKKNPGNRHLIRQLALVENAKISTIDSFCNDIVKNYYNTIDLDPNIRIADKGELSLIMEDVLKELLEEEFTKGNKEFIDFVECFSPGKNVNEISELISKLYKFAQSNPWPKEWLLECKKDYEISTPEEFAKLKMVEYITNHIKTVSAEFADNCKYILELCNEPSGPHEYIPQIENDLKMWTNAAGSDNYFDVLNALNIPFDKLSKSSKSDKDLRDEAQSIRKVYKEYHKNLIEEFDSDIEVLLDEMKYVRPYINVLINLTLEFSKRYLSAKQARNIGDFSDIAHYALDILMRKEGEEIIYSEVADELANEYVELYIDEYQDSNLVQEYLLNAISKERYGTPNIFMVGDVKQSIYRFRMARPELFMEKYDSYSPYSDNSHSKYNKIELHKNFRSRSTVLLSINDVFKKAMQKSIGGIDYTDEVSLNPGAEFTDEFDDRTEFVLAEDKKYRDTSDKIDNIEATAHIAAMKIKELMNVYDELNYKDFVILLRSDSKNGPIYASVLSDHGIPCVYKSSTGYFSAYEVANVLDLLNVIDNPRQEIPLAGVMRSYFAYFSLDEMATIKGRKRKTELYDCVVKYSLNDNPLGNKCRNLLDLINRYREKVGIYSIRDILSDIIYNTGYYDYISAIPGGSLKVTNLDMLIEKASEFEHTSYLGLFNFLRYIEKIQKYDVDYGEGGMSESDINQVRIMSIHKSKGLEFPVVILGDIGKSFNIEDTKNNIIFDSIYGIGMNRVDLKYRTRRDTTYKRMIIKKMIIDTIGEELRLLYVAMTRAVKKLILIGVDKAEGSMSEWERVGQAEKLDVSYLMKNRKYSSILAPGAVNNQNFIVSFYSRQYIGELMKKPYMEQIETVRDGFKEIESMETDALIYDDIKRIMEYKYPYCNILELKSKYSVSDLKHQAMEESELLEEQYKLVVPEKRIPAFIAEEEKEHGGILRGNAYHKVFEILDYSIESTIEAVNTFLDGLCDNGRLSMEYRELINPKKIVTFLNSTLGLNMKEAYIEGKLYREQPFIMEVTANEIDSEYPEDEKVLIQGIVDAFYIKDEGVCVIDYKTDSVPYENGEEILIERYKRQLKLYEYALNRILPYKVNKTTIYSVSLNKEVEII